MAAVLDLYARRIVGWASSATMESALVCQALWKALNLRKPQAGLLHHSDRGVQYTSEAYQTLLNTQGITVSLSRPGNCWDNAVMERFWGSLKSERTKGKHYWTREEAKQDVADYMDNYYNTKRLHAYLGYRSPAEYESLQAAHDRLSGRQAA